MNIPKFFSRVPQFTLILLALFFSLHAEEDFLSSISIQKIADFVLAPISKRFEAEKVKDGDIIYVEGCIFHHFFKNERSLIKKKYILITHGSDASMPGVYEEMLNDPNLIVWFSQNVNYSHPKLKYLPIGIDRIAIRKKIYLNTINELRGNPPSKTHLLFMNFRICTNPKERNYVFNLFKDKPYCFTTAYQKDVDLFLTDLAASKFILSPIGGGMDCYRTWEALYLGTIPVIRSCPLDPLYEDLPILIVKDWTEVTEEFLEKKYEEMSKKEYNLEKLTLKYWSDLINSYRSEYRKKQKTNWFF